MEEQAQNELWKSYVYGDGKRWDFKLKKKARLHKYQLIPVPSNDKIYLRSLCRQLKRLRNDLQLERGTRTVRKFYVTVWDFKYMPRYTDLIGWRLRDNAMKLRRQILICIGVPTRKSILCEYAIEELIGSLHIPRLTLLSWEHQPSTEQTMFLMAKLQGTIKKKQCILVTK